MKVCILGVARSGTTAIYSLVQEIMLENHEHVDFIYEPFLWDKDVFNGRYDEINKGFQYIDSLSVKGICQHLGLPLFIKNPDKYKDNEYLLSLFQQCSKDDNFLAKLIRANGRVLLLNKICPECRFIIIYRNPLDSINSVLNKFSYFGGEFHKDDYPRFIKEVNSLHHTSLTPQSFKSPFEKELAYWHYMNKFVFENLKKFSTEPLIIFHEEYTSDYETCIKKICQYLDSSYDHKYLEIAVQKRGDLTNKHEISKDDLKMVNPYMDNYFDQFKKYRPESKINKKDIVGRYKISQVSTYNENRLYGINPLVTKTEYEKLTKINLENTELIDSQYKLLGKNEKIILEHKELIAEKENIITEKEDIITEKEKNINQLEELVSQRDEIILKKDNIIYNKDQLILNVEKELENQTVINKDLNKNIGEKIQLLNDSNRRNLEYEKEIVMKSNEIKRLNTRITNILNSYTFKIGKIILYPVTGLLDLIKKKN